MLFSISYMEDKSQKFRILRYIFFCLLSLLCAGQIYIAIAVHNMSALFRSFDAKENLAIFIIYSEPFIWIYSIVTALIAIDIFRRKVFLILNSVCISISLLLGTVFIMTFVVLGGYGQLFEMGAAK